MEPRVDKEFELEAFKVLGNSDDGLTYLHWLRRKLLPATREAVRKAKQKWTDIKVNVGELLDEFFERITLLQLEQASANDPKSELAVLAAICDGLPSTFATDTIAFNLKIQDLENEPTFCLSYFFFHGCVTLPSKKLGILENFPQKTKKT